MEALDLGIKINTLLSETESINTLVGNKIYPLIAESDTSYPFIVFRRGNIEPAYSKDGRYEEEISVEVITASNKYKESVEVAKEVRKKLELYSDSDIKEITVNLITEEYNADCYLQRINFNIII